jgi:hypothetical protein
MQWKGHLLISTGDEEIVLSIKGSEVRVVDAGETTHVICGGQDIVQLILGTDTPAANHMSRFPCIHHPYF